MVNTTKMATTFGGLLSQRIGAQPNGNRDFLYFFKSAAAVPAQTAPYGSTLCHCLGPKEKEKPRHQLISACRCLGFFGVFSSHRLLHSLAQMGAQVFPRFLCPRVSFPLDPLFSVPREIKRIKCQNGGKYTAIDCLDYVHAPTRCAQGLPSHTLPLPGT